MYQAINIIEGTCYKSREQFCHIETLAHVLEPAERTQKLSLSGLYMFFSKFSSISDSYALKHSIALDKEDFGSGYWLKLAVLVIRSVKCDNEEQYRNVERVSIDLKINIYTIKLLIKIISRT